MNSPRVAANKKQQKREEEKKLYNNGILLQREKKYKIIINCIHLSRPKNETIQCKMNLLGELN